MVKKSKPKSYIVPTRKTIKFGDRILHPSGIEVQVVGGFIFGTMGEDNIIRYRRCLPSGKVSLEVYRESSWIK